MIQVPQRLANAAAPLRKERKIVVSIGKFCVYRERGLIHLTCLLDTLHILEEHPQIEQQGRIMLDITPAIHLFRRMQGSRLMQQSPAVDARLDALRLALETAPISSNRRLRIALKSKSSL